MPAVAAPAAAALAVAAAAPARTRSSRFPAAVGGDLERGFWRPPRVAGAGAGVVVGVGVDAQRGAHGRVALALLRAREEHAQPVQHAPARDLLARAQEPERALDEPLGVGLQRALALEPRAVLREPRDERRRQLVDGGRVVRGQAPAVEYIFLVTLAAYYWILWFLTRKYFPDGKV